jgi:hypothetical protein
MKKYLKYMYILIIIVLLSICVFIITHNDFELLTVISEKGNLDLSKWDETSILRLTGEWQYYDGLMIQDISNVSSQEYVYVPHVFKRSESYGNNPYGTATYKLDITGLDANKSYSIQILSETSAYRLTINGQDILSAGKVGYTADEHIFISIFDLLYISNGKLFYDDLLFNSGYQKSG